MKSIKEFKYLLGRIFIITVGCIVPFTSFSQNLTITNTAFNSYNASVSSILSIGVLNNGPDETVQLKVILKNDDNEVYLIVSEPLPLHSGPNILSDQRIAIKDIQYGNNPVTKYIEQRHTLPGGKFTLCYYFLDQYNEITLLENCDDIFSDNNNDLTLVSPSDGEEIETLNPILVWFHTEPFELLSENVFYKITVAEKYFDQNATTAILTNPPVFQKDHLLSHQVFYSIDAIPLESGKEYVWRVEQISSGVPTEQTDTWIFKLKKSVNPKDIKYCVLTSDNSSDCYDILNEKIFFRLDNKYNSSSLTFKILDQTNNSVSALAINEKETQKIAFSNHGYNSYELDLSHYDLKQDIIYTLEASSPKKEKFYLKFRLK